MVAIRLSRTGAKKRPSYRVVVIDSRRARDSRNIEIVGHYNPRPDPIEVVLKRDRIDYWVSVGAQMSDTVKRLVRHFDERVVDEAGNGAPAQVPAVAEAPEPAAPSLSAPGAPVPVAPGEELDDDAEAAEALAEIEGAAGPPAEPLGAEEPATVADASETAVVEEAEAVAKADSAPAAEAKAAVDDEPAAAPEPAADAEAAPAAAPEPEADPPGESVADADDTEPQPPEAKPE